MANSKAQPKSETAKSRMIDRCECLACGSLHGRTGFCKLSEKRSTRPAYSGVAEREVAETPKIRKHQTN
jgi:hypothetical protein